MAMIKLITITKALDYNMQSPTLGPSRLIIANLMFLCLPLRNKIVALNYKFISNMIVMLANLVLTEFSTFEVDAHYPCMPSPIHAFLPLIFFPCNHFL
jgi:hypothetical protein